MRLNRVKNTKRNIIWGTAEKAITMLFPFVVRTAFLAILGDEYLGLNGLFSSILQVLNLAELGFSNAVVYSMYRPIAEDDIDQICALMNFYKRIYRVIGSVVVGIGLLLLPFLPHLIKGSIPTGFNIYILYLIYLFNTAIGYFLFEYKNCLLNAYQREDIVSVVNIFCTIFLYSFQLIVLILTRNYYFYVVVIPVTTILGNIAKAALSSKIFPNLNCAGGLDTNEKKEIRKNVVGLFIGKACIISRNSFDSIFLSAFLGLKVVAIYGNYFYIITAINGVLLMARNAISAGVGNSIAINSVTKNYSDFQKLSLIYAWIAGWCSVCLLTLFQPFMICWVGKDLLFQFPTVILLCVYFYSMTPGELRSVYSNAAGLFWEGRYYVITEAVLNIFLNYIMGKVWGVNGIITATIITIIFVNFVWGTIVLFRYYFIGIQVKKYFTYQLYYLIATLVASIVTLGVSNFIGISGIGGLIVKGIICLIVPNCIFAMMYYRVSFFKESIELVKRMLVTKTGKG